MNAARFADATIVLIGSYPSVSEMPALSPSSLLRSLHDCFLHTVFAYPIQANLVVTGIVEIGMPPTPGHLRGSWVMWNLFAGACSRSRRVHGLRNTGGLDRHTALVRIEILSQVAVPARTFLFRSIFVKISFICSPFWSHV
jgi:hypothetical protein